MNVLAVIPARGGSKGIYKKNITNVANKPLIYYTISASLKSKFINKTIVSSDDDEILLVSKNYGADIIKRPYEISQDTTPSEPVVKHALNIFGMDFEYVVLLQPTSPLRTYKHIDAAFDMILNSKADALISVSGIDNKFLKSFFIKQNRLKPISKPNFAFTRRQDLPSVYMPNGAIYIVRTKTFLQTNSFYTDETIPFVMSYEDSIDVDSKDDIALCEKFLKNES